MLVVCVFFVEVHDLCSASKLPSHDQGYCHYYTFLRSLHFAIPRAYALYNCGGGALDLDLTNFTHGGGGRKKELRKRIPRGEPKSITFLPSFLPSFLDAAVCCHIAEKICLGDRCHIAENHRCHIAENFLPCHKGEK